MDMLMSNVIFRQWENRAEEETCESHFPGLQYHATHIYKRMESQDNLQSPS
jgi:hypothetical protein